MSCQTPVFSQAGLLILPQKMFVAFNSPSLYDGLFFNNERNTMNEHLSRGDETSVSGSQGDVVFLLKKLQEQLTFLERKVDILISQSKEKPSFNKERTFSKPAFRSSGSSYGDSRSSRSGPPREQSYESGNRSSGRPSFGHRDSRGFEAKKKPFFAKKHKR